MGIYQVYALNCENPFRGIGGEKNGRLITSHRSTTYPCYLPVLGDSAGAGRVRPAGCKIMGFIINYKTIYAFEA